jgi:hypothetical protein
MSFLGIKYFCDKCGVQMADGGSFKCKCGGDFKMEHIALIGIEPFKPYVLENGVDEPTKIESRTQRDFVFKENMISQKTFRQGKYGQYTRIFPVSGPCSKGSGTRWTGVNGLGY